MYKYLLILLTLLLSGCAHSDPDASEIPWAERQSWENTPTAIPL